MFTLTNDKTGETIQTSLTPAELAAKFAEVTGGNHWAFYWMAQVVNDATTPGMRDMIGFVSDLFVIALGRGLKNPMIRLGFKAHDRRYKLYLSAKGTVCLKGGHVLPGTSDPDGREEYIGCLLGAKFLPNRDRRPTAADEEFVANLNTDPVGFFAKCSKDMGRCCYCNLPLEDARSKEVGYGKICAGRWGLPWGTDSKDVPSFASLWARPDTTARKNIKAICQSIRQEGGKDEASWLVLRDALEEAGWPAKMLPSMPTAGRKMARV